MKVRFYLKRTAQNERGLCPIMGRITLTGKRGSTVVFGTKLKVDPKIWDSTVYRCPVKSRAARAINEQLDSILFSIHTYFEELKDKYSSVTAEQVKNSFQGIAAAQETLLKLFREHNGNYALRVSVDRAEATYDHYRNTYRLLSNFIDYKYKGCDVIIKSLDIRFITVFETYLREREKHKPETIIGHINRLKRIIFTAIERGIIDADPFEGFIIERSPYKQRYLDEGEFSKLMNTSLGTPARNLVRDMFLFASFSGLSYYDMRNLRESELKRDNAGNLWIITNRQKTGRATNVMLLDVAVKIIERYKGTAPDGKVFPIPSNSSVNKLLKEVAKQCGINPNLVFHQSRHTFASLICMQNGVPLETISRAMGHKNIQVTQKYAKVTFEKLDCDLAAWGSNMDGKYTLASIDDPPSTVKKDLSGRKYRPSRKLPG